MQEEIERIDPASAREHIQSGKALLVCAYDSEEKCRQYRLEGALTMGELKSRLKTLQKDMELIFYCA